MLKMLEIPVYAKKNVLHKKFAMQDKNFYTKRKTLEIQKSGLKEKEKLRHKARLFFVALPDIKIVKHELSRI